jgi:hypothetical protein
LERCLLLKPLEEQEFLFCCPLAVEEGEIKLIDYMVLGGVFVEIRETADAIVGVLSEELSTLADISFAFVTLCFV